MCGLAGIYYSVEGDFPQRVELEHMTAKIRHRGPDGSGFYLDEHVGLGHVRLSIIDIEGGNQPIHNEDKSIWVVFNGEIFNYIELREELSKRGHHFYTKTDTEVIVHAYEEYGEAFPEYLNGQFAIALWDSKLQKLILVRDRTGILPLFYSQHDGRILFASEVKAILAVFGQAPSLNAEALDQIMTFWGPVGSTSIFENINHVQPAEMIIIQGGELKVHNYWNWTYPEDNQYLEGDETELAEELYELLNDATHIRLRSDVPVGAYLSGGLDSSVLTSLIHQQGANLRTFSIGFSEESLDESGYQQMMINHLGTEHSRIHCQNSDVADAFERAIWFTESPILRTAPVPMMLLSGLVHESNYKVILTGEGSDEVLGGYDIFKEAKIRQFWARNPQSKFRQLLLKRLYPYLDISQGKGQAYLEAFFGAGLDKPDVPYFSHIPRWKTTAHCKNFFSENLKSTLINESIRVLENSLPANINKWHTFNRGQYIEAKSLMSGYLLCSQGDRMLSANSVEGRFPFLDHRVIEFANRLPPKFKMKVLNEKYLLKKSMQQYLPVEIVNRYKQPYRAPDIPAFFDQGVRDYVQDMLSESMISRFGYFEPKRVSHLLKKAEQGRVIGYKDNMAFIGILSTQIWHRHFIENYTVNFK